MNIYQKLIEVRKSCPYLKKGNQGVQYNYVSSSQTLGTLREKMDELGLLLIPSVTQGRATLNSVYDGKQHMTELDMVFTWVNADDPDETIVCPFYGQGTDSGEKGVGKALTYAEKYFMLKFFNIATDHDDPDAFQKKIESGDVGNNAPTTGKPSGKMTKKQKDAIYSAGRRKEMSEREIDLMVKWAAGKKKLPRDSNKVPDIFLGKYESGPNEGKWKIDTVHEAYKQRSKENEIA